MIGRLTTQVADKRLKCSSFRLTDLFLSYGYVGVKFIWFIPWLVEKGMIHEPTQRFKGLLGDTCNGCCCVDQNFVSVLTVYLHILYFGLLPYDNTVKYKCWVYIAG